MSPRFARTLADVSLLAVVAGWGYMFVPVKQVTALWPQHCLTFVALRFWVATAAFLPVLFCQAAPAGGRGASLRAGVGAGILMLLGYAFQTLGLRSTTAAVGAFITSLNVVFVPLGARLLGQRVSLAAFVGVAIATAGLAVLCLGDGDGDAPQDGYWLGAALVVLCAIAFAGQILVTDRQARRVDPIWFTASQCLVTAIGATLAALVFEVRRCGWPPLDAEVAGAAAICGVMGSTVSFTAQTLAQRVTPATHVAVIYASEPVFGALFAHWLLHERLTTAILIGAALILVGIACSEFGPRIEGRRRARRSLADERLDR